MPLYQSPQAASTSRAASVARPPQASSAVHTGSPCAPVSWSGRLVRQPLGQVRPRVTATRASASSTRSGRAGGRQPCGRSIRPARRQCRADRRSPDRTTRGRSRRPSCSSRHRSGAGRRRNRRQLASGSESRDHATRHRNRRHRRRLRFPVSRHSPRPGAFSASMPIGRPPRSANCLPGCDDSCFASGQMFLSAFAWAKKTTTHPGAHVAI